MKIWPGGRRRFVDMMFKEEVAKRQKAGDALDFQDILSTTASNVRKELGLPDKKALKKPTWEQRQAGYSRSRRREADASWNQIWPQRKAQNRRR